MVRAKELGMTHLATTPHGTLGGHRAFQKAAKDAGIVPILGLESYISPTDRFDKRSKAKRQDGDSVYNHIILLAQNETGLETLYKLNEAAWGEGFYQKPRIDTDLLSEMNDGLIVLSGCLNGLLCKAIERGDTERAIQIAKDYKSFLGDRFYVEVQAHNPKEMNHALLEIADKLGIKPVVTSDCHYARKEDLWIEEALLILSTNPEMNSDFELSKSQKMETLERFNYIYPDRRMTFQEIEVYLRSIEEHRAAFHEQGIEREDIYANTNEIASRIGEYPFYQGLDLLPQPVHGNADEILERKAWAGLKELGLDRNEKYRERLEFELKVIKDKDFSTYFLIVADMLDWARKQNILVGPGRGSAAGSLVCYALSITRLDPIKRGLLFFRFINPERAGFPDIDCDIQDSRRVEVMEYLRRKYKHVANIATVQFFKGASAVKAAARVYKIPVGEVNKATKKIDTWEEYLTSPETQAFRNKYPEVTALASELVGRISTRGKHPAGIVLGSEPLSNYVPIETAKDAQLDERVWLAANDMKEVEDIGLVKIDLLGLKTLSVVNDTLTYIKERRGIDIDLYSINLDDKGVYEMLSRGHTKGVFQFEAGASTRALLEIGGVSEFSDLVAATALVRPGAMDSIGPEYIARKKGKVPVAYAHPCMESFTKTTYGEILYQEQVMLTMTELAGMSMATADKVRKIIGKKRDVSEFEQYREEFVEGASQKVDRAVAEKLWHDFEAHANYSFNLSHAEAYSLVSYWSAWLKYHYPTEFIAALLNNEGDKSSMTDYLIEAKRLGIKVLLPHVNKSKIKFTIESDGAIRFGLENIKGISEITGTRLLKFAPFESYEQLREIVTAKGSGMGSRMLNALNPIGAASFPDNPKRGDERDYFYEYLAIPAFSSDGLEPAVKAQITPLDEYYEEEPAVILGMVKGTKTGKGWTLLDLVDESGSAGVFTNENTPIQEGQMYAMLVGNKSVIKYINVKDLVDGAKHAITNFLNDSMEDLTDSFVRVVACKARTTKAGKKMADLIVADAEKRLTHALVFPNDFHRVYSKAKEGATVDIQFGQTEDGTLFVKSIE